MAVGEGGADESLDSGGTFDDIVKSTPMWLLLEGLISGMSRCVT